MSDAMIPVYSNVTGYKHVNSVQLTELFCKQLQMSVSCPRSLGAVRGSHCRKAQGRQFPYLLSMSLANPYFRMSFENVDNRLGKLHVLGRNNEDYQLFSSFLAAF